MEFNLNLPGDVSENKSVHLDANKVYDVIIIGGGPAALASAVYCMRKGVSTGLVTMSFGGQVADTSVVENYLGYKYIEGTELAEKFREHVKQFEIGISEGIKVLEIIDDDVKKIILENGNIFQTKSIIITTGKSSRKLNVPGEKELTGRGVAYCSICDAPLFKNKKVAVVGGGNSGIESAIDLARVAEHVTIIQFLDKLTADDILIKVLDKFDNVDVLYEHEVKLINGTNSVESVTVINREDNKESILDLEGIFIEIGLVPNSDLVKGLLELNENGEVSVDCACKTSVSGIFAAGDVTTVPFKQIIIATGEGAKAALSACEYVLRK